LSDTKENLQTQEFENASLRR